MFNFYRQYKRLIKYVMPVQTQYKMKLGQILSQRGFKNQLITFYKLFLHIEQLNRKELAYT